MCSTARQPQGPLGAGEKCRLSGLLQTRGARVLGMGPSSLCCSKASR